MNEPFFPREVVAERLAISTRTLLRYESRGLIRSVARGGGGSSEAEGYGPEEVRRLWTIVTFQRDLGINLAGVEVILRLRDQLGATHHHLDRLVQDLQILADLDRDGPEWESDAELS